MFSRIFPILFVIDLMILPILHPFNIPFKVSYLLAVIGLIALIVRSIFEAEWRPSKKLQTDIFIAFAAVIFCSLVGEVWVSNYYEISDYSETWRSLLIYVLTLGSFCLGFQAKSVNLKWILFTYYAYVALTLVAMLLPDSPLIHLYYSDEDAQIAVYSGRVLGLFGNPNVSMTHHTVLLLANVTAMRHGLLQISSRIVRASLVILPFLMIMLISSRGGTLEALAVEGYYLWYLSKSSRVDIPLKVILLGFLVVFASSFIFLFYSEVSSSERASVVTTSLSRLFDSRMFDLDEDVNENILRPIQKVDLFWKRFKFSPLWGSGYNEVNFLNWSDSPRYYHNDIFRLLVTSGLIGTFFFLRIFKKYCLVPGIVMLVPFFFSGLLNTFLLHITAVCFYFFYVGLFLSRQVSFVVAENARKLPADNRLARSSSGLAARARARVHGV